MQNNKAIFWWLISGCLIIMLMVVVGGITRLTGSGLSITEWNVIMGAVPPMNHNEWQIAFEKYQASPQFKQMNSDMNLSEFKFIFFWEYIHRLIGRLLGIVFVLPFLWFLIKQKLNAQLIKRSLFLFLLGGLQGFIGWYMVKSGLINMPWVSHYRLALHLFTAFITFGFTLWFALDLLEDKRKLAPRALIVSLRFILFTSILQIIYGAFVAGMHAGKIHNTFPKMDEEWLAHAAFSYQPIWKNFLENPSGVQFIHRCIAWILSILIITIYFKYPISDSSKGLKSGMNLMLIALIIQFLLGVFTLLFAVPIWLGVVHQLGAFLLFSVLIFVNHQVSQKN